MDYKESKHDIRRLDTDFQYKAGKYTFLHKWRINNKLENSNMLAEFRNAQSVTVNFARNGITVRKGNTAFFKIPFIQPDILTCI